MPAIYLQTGDGTRIAVPEGAEELSMVVRRALDIWAESHCPPTTQTEEDGDNICTSSGIDSERTPDRILDDDDDDDEEEEEDQSTDTHSARRSRDNDTTVYKDSREYEGERLRGPNLGPFDELDPLAGFLDAYYDDDDDDDEREEEGGNDDERSSSRTPSVCRSLESPSPSPAPSPMRGQRKTPRRGGRSKCNSHDGSNAGGSLDVNDNGGRLGELLQPCASRGDACKEDSETPSTLGDEAEEEMAPSPGTVGGVQQRSVSLDAPPVPETNVPCAYAHPLSPGTLAAPAPKATPTSSSSSRGSDGNNNNGKFVHPESDSPPAATMVVVSRGGATTVRVAPPSAVGEEGGEGYHSSGVPASLSPRSLTNEEMVSPSCFHQRTPCMVGDDDEGLLLMEGNFSFGEEVVMLNRSKALASPGNNSSHRHNNNSAGTPRIVEASPRSPVASHRLTETTTSNPRARSTAHSSSLGSSNQNVAAWSGVVPLTEGLVAGQLHQCFVISAEEIVIEAHKHLLPAITTTPATEQEVQSRGLASQSFSHNFLLRDQFMCATPALAATVLPTSAQNQLESVTATPAPAAEGRVGASEDSNAGRPTIPREAWRLCMSYLRYFTSDAGSMQRPHPTIVPEPLSAPLVRFLTLWERGFLYGDILGQTEEETALALKILRLAPTMSYTSAAPFLRKPDVCAALLVKAPAPDRVGLLADVTRAAGMLEIPSLENLCLAWCADYIIRASYASMNCFEAAALLRQCFSVRSDWTRKEMECLSLENEWPSNEEE
ncbi:uncharacterized protein Tco025E_05067 [Trypanosoma conorhini]|uniref:BTB domain-containing protein n=1 Tax=Trypanosoma conorhini TaxID=83891 RepID=A0A422PHA5_9TRYP|nr:uncharacterized protein Tco025E_05067 [Trypanosoma conorhini]RNF17081.1 hypothetical protein Tco025E_05067 [Trypanosoma conorhini]